MQGDLVEDQETILKTTSKAMGFTEAFNALDLFQKVRRSNWYSGRYLIIDGDDDPVIRVIDGKNNYMWSPLQEDLFAKNWEIVR